MAEAVAVGTLMTVLAPACHAQEKQEYEVKAGFLLNFVRFVEWPPAAFLSRTDPLTMCVYADDPFQGALERTVAGKMVGERAVVVRHIPDTAASGGCHLIFFPASQDRRTRQILVGTASQPVLLVGEMEGFAERGGSVNFVFEGDKLRFQINPRAAADRGMKVSSKLLQLAVIVKGKGSK
jgi:hypothetical protein